MRSPEAGVFQDFLARYGGKKLAIAAHDRADVDAVSSAYALSLVLPGSVLCSDEEPGEGAKMLAEKLGVTISPLRSLDRKTFDGLVAVDTSAYTLMPAAKNWRIALIIDHHRPEGRDMKGEFEILDPDSPSTAELLAGILPEISKEAAFGLAVGIIADGARFKSARARTFEALAKMMTLAGAPYKELLNYAEPEPKPEAKIAMLKAMQRVEFVYSNGYMIATSEIGSNESDAASLITEAADVAFVAKWKDEEKATRISARARNGVSIPLNQVMSEVAGILGGAGGGHAKAAGASLNAHTKEALEQCVETFRSFAEREGK